MELKLLTDAGITALIFTDNKHSISKEFKEKLFSGEIKDMKDYDDDEYYIEYLGKVKVFLKWLKTNRAVDEICENFNMQFNVCYWSGSKQILKSFDENDYKYYKL
jgi:hypothetical protein